MKGARYTKKLGLAALWRGLFSGGATFGIYWRPQKIDVNLGGGYFRGVVTIGTLR